MFVTSCPAAFASSVSSGARCRLPRLVGSNGACISGGSHARVRAAGDTVARYSRASKPSIRAPQDTPSTADTDTTAAIPTASTHTCSTDGYPPHPSSSSVSSYAAVAVTLGQATVIVSSVVCSSSSSVVVAVLPGVSRGVSIEVLGHVRAHTLPHLLHALLLARVGVVADTGDERGLRADEFVFLVFFVRALDLVFLDARLSMLKRVCDASARGEYLGRCLDPRRG